MTAESRHRESPKDEAITIHELFSKLIFCYKYLLGKWKAILLVGIFGAALGFVYAAMKKPIYTATTTFVLESGDSGAGMGQYAGLASMVGIDLGSSGGGIFQGDNILELYKSRTMISKTLLTEVNINNKKQLLIDYYIAFNSLRESWAEQPELLNMKFTGSELQEKTGKSRLKDSLINIFVASINKNNLVVDKLDKKLSIIKVDVNSTDEIFAKTFNDLIVSNVNDFYIQTKTKKSMENVNILSTKVDSVRAVLNGAIYAGAAVADATPNLNPTRQIQRSVPMQRSQFSAETNKGILSELIKNLELSKMSLLKEAPLIQIVDQPNFPLRKEQTNKIFVAVAAGIIMSMLTAIVLLGRLFIRSLNPNVVV
jgi:hypothetical protein